MARDVGCGVAAGTPKLRDNIVARQRGPSPLSSRAL
jgi:hypothetical protein